MKRPWTRVLAGPILSALLASGCGSLSMSPSADTAAATDERIAAEIKRALFDELGIAASAIGVQMQSDSILLHGFVETDAERRVAEQKTRALAGRRSVQNTIEVK